MEFVDPERGEELHYRAQQILSEEVVPPEQPRAFSSVELHEYLAAWGFRQEPLEPGRGTKYIRHAPEYPEIDPLVLQPADPVGPERLERAVSMVEAVWEREGYESKRKENS